MKTGSMVLVVRTEQEREEAAGAIQRLEERWRPKFRVELEA